VCNKLAAPGQLDTDSCTELLDTCGTQNAYDLVRIKNGRILLVNPLQSSRSTFSRGSLLSFFAFKEGMLGTLIPALGG
jgi:hypothetical protein